MIETYIKALSDADNTLEIITGAACAAYVSKNYSRVDANAPKAIIYPRTAAQIEKIVALANEHETALVVRSSQGNETYHGASVPAKDVDAVAVNLSKMTKIMHIDAKNGTALIEPGVTYKQLNEALKPYGCLIEQPLLPREEKSIIASLLDRDPVMTPKHCWDVPDPLACVELVMGNGSVFRTGSAAGPGTLEEMLESGCAINQPQGPYTLDLARVISGAQGTLAIVTWASVKIRQIGSVRKVTYVQSDCADTLAKYASQIIRRRLGENVFIVNASGLTRITGTDTGAMPKWTLICDAKGYRYFPERYMNDQIADMKDIAATMGLEVKEELDGLCNQKMGEILDGVSKKGDYWRDRGGTDKMDLFFLSTMDKLGLYTTLAETAVEKCGLDPADLTVYCQPEMMGRSCHIEYLIPADDEKAAELERMLGTTLLDNKAFFSRPYGALTEKVYEKSMTQTPFLPHVKGFFDEKNILNPGRLVYDGGRK